MAGESKRFENTGEFEGAHFENVSFAGATFRNANFFGVRMEAMLAGAELYGPIDGLKINGVEVEPLIEAELVRLHPELGLFKSKDLDEMRQGLAVLEGQLAATWDRFRALPEEARQRRVNEEWSGTETLRHLVFVVDLWLRRQALALDDAYHPMGLPPSHAPASPPGTGIDASASPSFGEAIAVWDERLAQVREVLATLTDQDADATKPLPPGFPPRPETVSKRQGLRVVMREAWAHNRYMLRDLEVLETDAT